MTYVESDDEVDGVALVQHHVKANCHGNVKEKRMSVRELCHSVFEF